MAGGGLMAFGACCIVSRACFEETVSALLRGSQSRKSRVPRIIPFLASALGVFSLLSDSCLLLVLTPPCFFLPVFVFSHRSDRSSTLSLFCLSHSPHIPLSFGFLFCFLKTIFRIFCFVSLLLTSDFCFVCPSSFFLLVVIHFCFHNRFKLSSEFFVIFANFSKKQGSKDHPILSFCFGCVLSPL